MIMYRCKIMLSRARLEIFFMFLVKICQLTVVDPGFPTGGCGPHREGVDFSGGYISNILYVKMKESGPLGGRAGYLSM